MDFFVDKYTALFDMWKGHQMNKNVVSSDGFIDVDKFPATPPLQIF